MIHVIVAGCAGIMAGGYLNHWLLRRGHTDATMRVGLLASVLWIPTGILYPLAPNGWAAWALMVPTYFFTTLPTGAAPAAIQNIMPNIMRGQASAVYLLITNLLGQAAGPTGVALFTDYVYEDPMKLPYSMIIVGCVCHVIAVVCFAAGMRPYRESVERMKTWNAAHEAD
jgi:hypothetical protein